MLGSVAAVLALCLDAPLLYGFLGTVIFQATAAGFSMKGSHASNLQLVVTNFLPGSVEFGQNGNRAYLQRRKEQQCVLKLTLLRLNLT